MDDFINEFNEQLEIQDSKKSVTIDDSNLINVGEDLEYIENQNKAISIFNVYCKYLDADIDLSNEDKLNDFYLSFYETINTEKMLSDDEKQVYEADKNVCGYKLYIDNELKYYSLSLMNLLGIVCDDYFGDWFINQ